MRAVGIGGLVAAAAVGWGQVTVEKIRTPISIENIGEYRISFRNDGPPQTLTVRAPSYSRSNRARATVDVPTGRSIGTVYLPDSYLSLMIEGIPRVPDVSYETQGARLLVGASSRKAFGGNSGGQEIVSVVPEDIPSRSLALEGIGSVALESTARSLTDRRIEALRRYAFTGGTVVTGTELASDPRFRALVAVRPDGQPLPGATVRGSRTIFPYGQGKLISLTGRVEDRTDGDLERLLPIGARPNYGEFGEYAASPDSTPRTENGLSEKAALADPFSATLPPLSKVATVLLAYVVIVLPLNFLILRKLKRPQLAWLTAPALAALFCGALLRTNAGLASGSPARASEGIVWSQEGVPGSYIDASTLTFLPRAGSLTMGMAGYESVSATAGETVETTEGSNLPTIASRNLAYGRIQWRKFVDDQSVSLRATESGWTVKNVSSTRLTSGVLYARGQEARIPVLKPGASVRVELSDLERMSNDSDETEGTKPRPGEQGARFVARTAQVSGEPPLGRVIRHRQQMFVVHLAPEAK